MRGLLSLGKAEPEARSKSPWLHREFVRCYARWREECAAVRESFDVWTNAEPHAEPLAHAAYVAALDREERAADVYRECAERFALQAA
jgi:hypothetical protein